MHRAYWFMCVVCFLASSAFVNADPASPDSAASGTPRACMQKYLRSLEEENQSALDACFDTRNQREEDLTNAYNGFQLAKRTLSHDVAKRFHASEQDMCDEVAHVSDEFIKKMLAAAEAGAEQIDGDKGTLTIAVEGQSETVSFVKQGGGWKLDLLDYFHWTVRPSEKTAGLSIDRSNRERALVAKVSADVRSGSVASVKDAMSRVMEGME